MARKSHTGTPSMPIRGRPPLPPRTEFGQWLRDTGRTVVGAAGEMIAIARELGLPRKAALRPKTLLDSVNGRHRPSLETVLIVRTMTKGAIDVQNWIPKRRSRTVR